MPIQATVTGIDARTNIDAIPARFELGFLFSATPDGKRQPDRRTLAQLVYRCRHGQSSLHVCGMEARRQLLDGEIPDLLEWVQRIQVNGHVGNGDLLTICHRHPKHTIITQATPNNSGHCRSGIANHAMLVDGSGGRGVLPREWVRPQTEQAVGFAGGLSPDTLLEQLPKIQAVACGKWWIDMENGVRDADDWFDVDRAKSVACLLTAFETGC